MKTRTSVMLGVLALILLIPCGYWLKGFLAIDQCLDSGGRWNSDTGTCEYAETRAYPGNSKTYINDHYLFAFDYSAGYDLKKLGRWSFDLVRTGTVYLHGSVEDLTFNIFIKESKPQGDIFHSFSRSRVKIICGADGPDGSRSCERIQSEKEYITPNGLRVLEFYLIVTQENYVRKTKHNSTMGPVYMVDISRANHSRSLMIYPGDGNVSTDDIDQLAREILTTMRLVN